MSAKSFAAAVVVTGTLTFAGVPAIAEQASTPQASPATNSTSTEPVQLSQGVEDVLKLARAKISDDIICEFIENGDRHFRLSASEIVFLRDQGVSSRVLVCMLSRPPKTAIPSMAPQTADAARAAPPPASTVYVVPNTTTYYAFDGSWPYWYDWWPYPYRSHWYVSWWYPYYYYSYPHYWYSYYPHCSVAYSWAHCGYYHRHHNRFHHHNYYAPNYPIARGGRSGAVTLNPTTPVNLGRNPRHPDFAAGRSSGTALTTRPSTFGRTSINRLAGPTARTGVGGQVGRTTGNAGMLANNRATPTAPAQVNRLTTRPLVGSAPRQPNILSGRSQSTSRPIGTSAPTAWNTPPSRSYYGTPGAGYRTAPVPPAPNFGYRSGGSSIGASRPGVTRSFGAMPSTGAFRGGGGFSGGAAPRMYSGGGFHGGGGGGGFRGGGGNFHGGMGGGRR